MRRPWASIGMTEAERRALRTERAKTPAREGLRKLLKERGLAEDAPQQSGKPTGRVLGSNVGWVAREGSDIQELLDWVTMSAPLLTDWESQFVESVKAQAIERNGLTRAQYDKLVEVAERVDGGM